MEIKKEYELINESIEEENRLLKMNLQNKQEQLDDTNLKLECEKNEKQQIKAELDSIKYSRSYKIIQKLKKILWWRRSK